ncbi:MAG: hypothetical protein ACYS0E_04750 [Planctomycetota bacterium]|jgi:hypothetical protein
MFRVVLGIGLLFVAALLAPAAASGPDGGLKVTIVRAPVAPDGTTAGAQTDFVLTFVDRDPAVDGVALKKGAKIEVYLPDGFKNTGPQGNNVVLLQGWPQSPQVPFPYSIDIDGNKVTLTLTKDWKPGDVGPGVKQCHLVLLGFRNPTKAGPQKVALKIQPEPGARYMAGVGTMKILPRARPSVNVVSLFSGGGPPPPFNNPLYQCVEKGDDPHRVGLYLWDKDSAPFVGVDIAMDAKAERRGGHVLRHGRFVDENGDTVGQVWIEGPSGATGVDLTTEGKSVKVNAFVTGVPVGLLLTQFTPDPKVKGDYTVRFKLNNGNTETLSITMK